MNASRRAAGLLGLAALAAAFAGCSSTQEQSARAKRAGAKLIHEKGLVVSGTNANVSVIRTGVVRDANGVAVAVVLRNTAPAPAIDVPIAIDVRDAKGTSVFKNDAPGLDASLTAISTIPAHGEVTWVNDQVTADGTPATVSARLGAANGRANGPLPDIVVGAPKVLDDPVSGLELSGTVTNRSSSDQTRLVVAGVAWKGARLAAAGRAVVEKLTRTKPARYHILPIGRPQGARVAVVAIPAVTTTKRGS
jgi:hypothetical protein